MKLGLYFLLGMFTFVACNRSGSPDGQTWVAKVNKREISVSEVEQTIAKLAKYINKDFSQESVKKELMKDLVNKELLFQEALKEKIHEKSLTLKDQIVQEYLWRNIENVGANLTEEEIKKVYDEKKDDLEKVRASHILIKPTKPGNDASEAEARKKAEKILEELRSKGEKVDFAEYVNKYSEDAGSKSQGGDLVFFRRQDMVPEFSEAAFRLSKVGDLSDVVKTQFGYHIIKLTGDSRGLEALKPQIINQFSRMRQKERFDALLDKLGSSAKIQTNEAALDTALSSRRAPEVRK